MHCLFDSPFVIPKVLQSILLHLLPLQHSCIINQSSATTSVLHLLLHFVISQHCNNFEFNASCFQFLHLYHSKSCIHFFILHLLPQQQSFYHSNNLAFLASLDLLPCDCSTITLLFFAQSLTVPITDLEFSNSHNSSTVAVTGLNFLLI